MAHVTREKQWGTPPGGYRYGELSRSLLPTRLRRQLLHLQPFRSTLRRRMKYGSKTTGLESLRKQFRNVLSSVGASDLAPLVLEGVPVGSPWMDDSVLDAVDAYGKLLAAGNPPERAFMEVATKKYETDRPAKGDEGWPEIVNIGGVAHAMPHHWLRERGPMTQHFLLNAMMRGYPLPDMPFPDDPAWDVQRMADLLRKTYGGVADRLDDPEDPTGLYRE